MWVQGRACRTRAQIAWVLGHGLFLGVPACTAMFPLDEVQVPGDARSESDSQPVKDPNGDEGGDEEEAGADPPANDAQGSDSAGDAASEGSDLGKPELAAVGGTDDPSEPVGSNAGMADEPAAGADAPPLPPADVGPPPAPYPEQEVGEALTCEDLAPCGGDPSGTWDITGFCGADLSMAEDILFGDQPGEACVDLVDLGGTLTGSVSFSPIDESGWRPVPEGIFSPRLEVEYDLRCIFDEEASQEVCEAFGALTVSEQDGILSAPPCELRDYELCHCSVELTPDSLGAEAVPRVTADDICVRGDEMILTYRVPDDATYFVPLRRRAE